MAQFGLASTLSGLAPQTEPRVARTSQPWAIGWNLFEVRDACRRGERATPTEPVTVGSRGGPESSDGTHERAQDVPQPGAIGDDLLRNEFLPIVALPACSP